MRRNTAAAGLIAAAVILSGCWGDISGEDITDTSETTEETVMTGEAVPVFIEGTPEKRLIPDRAICMTQSLAEIVTELGYADKIIGRGTYCDHPERVAELPDAGRPTQPDIDMISVLTADAVLTSTEMSSIDKAAIENTGAAVVYIAAPRSFSDLEQTYMTLGKLFGGEVEGEKAAKTAFLPLKEAFENAGANIGRFIYMTEGLCAAGGDTFESAVLSFFGENAAAEQSGYIGDMTFLDGNMPDTILLNDEYEASELAGIFGGALEQARIIYVDNSYFESPSGRLTELAGKLSEQGGINAS